MTYHIPEPAPEPDFSGLLRLVVRVTRSGRGHERRGTFDNIEDIAFHGVNWWFLDHLDWDISEEVEVTTEADITIDRLPPVPKGESVTIDFPVRIRKLDAFLSNDDAIEVARKLVHQKVSEGGDDFEGLEDFRVEFLGEWSSTPPDP